MEKVEQILTECLNDSLIRIIISNCRDKNEADKIIGKPFMEGGNLFFQFAEYRGKQVFHTNLEHKKAKEHILSMLTEKYRQMEILTECRVYNVLISKKGKVTVKSKKTDPIPKLKITKEDRLSHNRKKQYILPEGEAVPFLVHLGVQTAEGKTIQKKYKKFRQINRFLEFVQDVLPALPKERKITIVDFGCGKSYLTFAMYYYLKVLNGYNIRMIGLDLKQDVIDSCNSLARELEYDELTFYHGDIRFFEEVEQVDMVVTLHACDTATDYALDKAIRWGAKVILSVPCCQHELNEKMQNELLQPVLKYGILKEKMAALLTDGVRAGFLEEQGYDVQILEFIDMEHTPKNLLIRAVYTGKKSENGNENRTMREAFNLHGTLEYLLKKG